MRVVITGAGGFVGRHVAAAFRTAGHDVVALDRAALDVTDPAAVGRALAGADVVGHLAARVRVRESREDPAGYWRTNLDGTRNVLAACSPATRVVLASTASIHTASDAPIAEDAPLGPTSPYAASKLAADLLARDLAAAGGPGVVSLRTFNVAGPGDRDTSRVLPALLSGRPFRVNGDGSAVRDYLHVADLADAVVAAVDAAEPGTWRPYAVGSGRGTSVAELVDTVARVTGERVLVEHGPAVAEPARLVADHSRITAELGWRPRRSDPRRVVADTWSSMRRYAE
ncbi:NAD-dependent epimerase/dehydratase family protein [Actinomycetospora sp. NBRC 106378]|uniref:NAD-dependent epimerase/dehydratase family protein n=1 Tax=Actinomycetospora sp. NBRC 106378 TaxID=3032208 RepID=UPI0024A5F935|nr:NAD-dependent epimerase/dehydratase family protein [Actinomycetospora sp. NBRC 106378]GLZ56026.1 UDP-glucose 4-epimerase GalE [Actinomycetospora sp. NBRC 106378]